MYTKVNTRRILFDKIRIVWIQRRGRRLNNDYEMKVYWSEKWHTWLHTSISLFEPIIEWSSSTSRCSIGGSREDDNGVGRSRLFSSVNEDDLDMQ